MTPFSTEDLSRVFDPSTLSEAIKLTRSATIEVTLKEPAIAIVVEHGGERFAASLTPSAPGKRVMFIGRCSCGVPSCVHQAAGALEAQHRFPSLRSHSQPDLLAALSGPAAPEKQKLVFEVSPGEGTTACFVTPLLVGVRTGRTAPTTPAAILADPAASDGSRRAAEMLGTSVGTATAAGVKVAVAPGTVTSLLGLLARTGQGRWHASGKPMTLGEDRTFAANLPPNLPPKSGVVLGDGGPWYVDGATGAVGRIRLGPAAAAPKPTPAPAAPTVVRPALRQPAPAPARPGGFSMASVAPAPPPLRPRPPLPGANRPGLGQSGFGKSRPAMAPRAAAKPAPFTPRPRDPYDEPARPRIDAAEPLILDRPLTPVLQLRRVECPDETGRIVATDALALDFDYGGVLVPHDDERQFVRLGKPGAAESFVRRDRDAEAAALAALRQDNFVQMRVAEGGTAKGRTVHLFRGRDAAERWHAFSTERVPVLEALGWRNRIDKDFGPRYVQTVGAYDMRLTDVAAGTFSLDMGVELDGERVPLVPILSRLLERGGMSAAQVEAGEVVTSLPDGRILKLPAERVERLLAVMADLLDSARRAADGALVLPDSEAPGVLELEDLMPARWENAAAIQAYADRFRGVADIPPVPVPAAFRAELRPYQREGVAWLQHLRAHGLGGLLADDMGLGKTAQTIAHLVIEHAEGRLDRPALVVVPTSLVANWSAELRKFAPHLRTVVLHGLERHAQRARLAGVHVAITTYTVLARDVEEMKLIPWHIVVLDEAQVIKSPDSKSTKAVVQMDTRHRLCLSGTPIENNLQELWSEFAFLMPGLLGDRKGFAKRFRTPIEKNGDPVRRTQLVRRIQPFLLRRTKFAVAADLPPKHTILRRVNLQPEQRELYETIRGTLYDQVREKMAELTAAQGRMVVLDALLKLRQVCCDPRLVKLQSARSVDASSKLDELMDMVGEMLPEGRRILLFSQFTSMLDLIKERMDAAGIPYVELRGDTRDRAEPVRRFEAGEVPLFLISLKAGGRGLNLTAADTVIHYDPWWNPAAEDQASDRAHRIGQTKPVFVYKLVAADTVEDRILELQQHKADLARIALSGEEPEEGIDTAALDNDDVAFLFGGADPVKEAA